MKIILILLIMAPVTLQKDPNNLEHRFKMQNLNQFEKIIKSAYL